jgi:hypothetical protein
MSALIQRSKPLIRSKAVNLPWAAWGDENGGGKKEKKAQSATVVRNRDETPPKYALLIGLTSVKSNSGLPIHDPSRQKKSGLEILLVAKHAKDGTNGVPDVSRL